MRQKIVYHKFILLHDNPTPTFLHKCHFRLYIWTLSLSEFIVKGKTIIMNVFVYIKTGLVKADRKIIN